MSLFDLFRRGAGSPGPSSAGTDTVRRIVQALDQLEPARAKFLAAFAYLLSRAARADLDISPEETRVMERIVRKQGGLPADQAVLVIQLAKTQNILFGATDNYLVTREFNAIATHEQKLHLLDCIYAVAAADHSVSTVEENEIRQIADELRIEHPDFISVRTRYRRHLAVLQDSAPATPRSGGQND